MDPATWPAVFTAIARKKRGQGWKTTAADEITWSGSFEGMPLIVLSRVRLRFGNLAHFVVNSGARIGAHDWNLPGGHYVDLRVYSPRPLDDSQLQRLGQLAAAGEDRPIRIRRWEECLSEAVDIRRNSEIPACGAR
jgi:hypothetical protein